jgi:hypothetical protein
MFGSCHVDVVLQRVLHVSTWSQALPNEGFGFWHIEFDNVGRSCRYNLHIHTYTLLQCAWNYRRNCKPSGREIERNQADVEKRIRILLQSVGFGVI